MAVVVKVSWNKQKDFNSAIVHFNINLGEFRFLCYVLSGVSIGWTCSSCLRIHSTLFLTAEHAVVNISAYLTCETANRIIDVLLLTVMLSQSSLFSSGMMRRCMHLLKNNRKLKRF